MSRRVLVSVTAVRWWSSLPRASAVLIRQSFLRAQDDHRRSSPSTTGIYPGDDVRVVGIKVGSIESIQPEGRANHDDMTVDRDVPVPLDARAVIVAPNLVAARYVQLTPAYEDSGPTMRTAQ